MSERLSEALAVVGAIDPQVLSSTTKTTDVIDASKFDSVLFIVSVGAVTSSGTIDFTVYEGTASGTVTTSVTSITALDWTDDNKQALVEIDTASLSGPNYRYIKGVLVADSATGAGTYGGVIALGGKPRFHPASDDDLASVAEIVTT